MSVAALQRTPIARLRSTLDELQDPIGCTAIHLHLSRLRPNRLRSFQLRLAMNALHPLLETRAVRVFALRNDDFIMLAHGLTRDRLEPFVRGVRRLFGDDPLARSVGGLGEEDGFATWYDLEIDSQRFTALIDEFARAAQHDAPRGDWGAGGESADSRDGRALDPLNLGRIENALEGADLSELIRWQPICMLGAEAGPQPVFAEAFVSTADLRRRLVPGINLTASRWLFQHLTSTLDRRVLLALMERGAADRRRNISINLNVSSVMSDAFARFDAAVRAEDRPKIVLEVQKVDVFDDTDAFCVVRDTVRRHGYRLCLDGLNYRSFLFIDRAQLGVDLVKLIWDPELTDGPPSGDQDQLREAIARTDPARVILCRCGSEEAIAWGQAMGIKLFQGHFVDRLLRARQSTKRERDEAPAPP
jgi:EAL domain-containing protein (putative c-di-GMP-specific phosphodiesterase class I)